MEKHNRLTVLERWKDHNKAGKALVLCDCGVTKEVFYWNLRKRKNPLISCGCYRIDSGKIRSEKGVHSSERSGKYKHGYSGTRLYGIWKGMRKRCNNPKSSVWKHYGGKGVTICQEWDNFCLFKEWSLSNGYKENLSIDRLDVNGNYGPKNCRWATDIEQGVNKTTSLRIEYNGELFNGCSFARKIGCSLSSVRYRLNKGYSPEDIYKELFNKIS